jgi:chemotaxis protein methyltransferase CheR
LKWRASDVNDCHCVEFLQWALPRLDLRWPGYRKVRRTVCKRVDRRMRDLGLRDVADYRAFLELHGDEWKLLDAWCRISISRFFRDRGVWELLREHVLPHLVEAAIARGEQTLRVWSAGCASGEEPYSLQVLWRLALQQRYPQLDMSILATDANATMLKRAEAGCYSASSLKEVPPSWVSLEFEQKDDLFCARPEIRSSLEFKLQDIRYEAPPGPFHLVLCRNLVFTYFDTPLQERIGQRLCDALAQDGVMVIGKHEKLPAEVTDRLYPWSPTNGVYRLGREERDEVSGRVT